MGLSLAARLIVLSALVLGPTAFALPSTPAAPVASRPTAPQPLPAPPPAIKPAAGKPLAAKPGTAKPGTAKPGSKKLKGPKKPRTTTVLLYHLNRRDTFVLRQRDMQGRPPKGFQKRFDRFLRCHYTNKQHAMHPRLVRLLYQTGRHWPGQRIEVVSGYRNPTVAKNPRSPHMKGLACDFRVVGVRNTELRDYLRRTMQKVGVGYYPNSSFVHLDVRKDRSAFWIDYSGPGERALYSQTPAEDLKTGRADSYHPTKIGDDWANDAPPDKSVPADDEAEAKAQPKVDPPQLPNPPAGAGPALAGQPAKPSPSVTP